MNPSDRTELCVLSEAGFYLLGWDFKEGAL